MGRSLTHGRDGRNRLLDRTRPMQDEPATATLDARGLNCPLPVLKARKRLMGMGRGDRLLVLATDPKAPDDLRHFCAEAGHKLLQSDEADGGGYRFVIERG
jgi:tRNA 2-thiouridine synthesizing protein A